MISESTKQYCSEDISLIENYDEAIADKTQIWDCHHRLEIQGPFTNSPKLLKRCGMYYGVPASQLVFLTHAEHKQLHWTGHHHSQEAKRKISESKLGANNPNFGKCLSDDTRRKISESMSGEKNSFFGKHHSQEARRKMSEAWKARKKAAQKKKSGH